MVLANDVILGTNEWIDILIDGSTTYTITGLQDRMNILFPDKGVVVEFANNEYLLPNQSNYGRELEHPFIAISCRFHNDKPMYWKDALPKLTDHIGWPDDLSIRFDVWGRTPPETRDLADAVLDSIKLMKLQLWAGARTKLVTDGEVENYVDKLEGVPDLWHRSVNSVLSIFRIKEVD